MQIRTIRKGFEAFDCKFEPFERTFEAFELQIRTIQIRDSKHSNANSNPSNEFRIIRMQILTIRKGFEAFECKF